MSDPRPERLRFRLYLEDGPVLVDEEVTDVNLEAAAGHHGELAKRYLDLGHVVWLEVTDPDGIIPPFALRSRPAQPA